MEYSRKCIVCKKEFKKPLFCSKKEWNKNYKVCSWVCRNKRLSDEMKGNTPKNIEVIKNYWRGKTKEYYPRPSMVGRKVWNKGLKGFMAGKKHYNWQGGITPENAKIRNSIEIRLWREAVFARDNWTCQKCNIRGLKLHCHHLKNFADYQELRTSIENGITLCKSCHKEFHKINGRRNNTKEQFYSYKEIN